MLYLVNFSGRYTAPAASGGGSDLRRVAVGQPEASGGESARGELRLGEQLWVRPAASIAAVASSGWRRLLGAGQIIRFSYPFVGLW